LEVGPLDEAENLRRKRKDEMKKIWCVIMRGGTSKAVVLREADLPVDPEERKQVILKIFGSPDVRQIDGLGGADPLTSKCAVLGPPSVKNADINYTFYQVGIETPFVREGLCGNISSIPGPFAVDEGLVKAVEPVTTVRIYNTTYKRNLYAEVPVKDGKAAMEGDCHIAGVPGTGARIMLDWREIVGTMTGKLLPTGHLKDKVKVEGVGELTVSILDSGGPAVFLAAEEIGLKGTETAQEIDSNDDWLNKLETIRGTVGEMVGLIKDRRKSAEESPEFPFLVFVNKATPYTSFSGKKIPARDSDFVARMMFLQKLHKTYAASVSICTGTAAVIPGTVVNDYASDGITSRNVVRIGHPGGVMEIESAVEKRGGEYKVTRSSVPRTARRIMDGYVYIR
jgi:methylitaconate Delta-isomerase